MAAMRWMGESCHALNNVLAKLLSNCGILGAKTPFQQRIWCFPARRVLASPPN